MGRYIGIGLLFQVDADPESLSSDILSKFYSARLFDYSTFKESGSISLNSKILPSEIGDLRQELIEFFDLPDEGEKEQELRDDINKATSLEELFAMAWNHSYYTFQEMDQRQLRFYKGKPFFVENHFILLYSSSSKFFPSGGHLDHEITRKIDWFINLGIKNYLKDLTSCFITQ